MNDSEIVKTAFIDAGRNYVDDLSGGINRAKTIAFDGIEKDLKAGGILARTDQDPHVLISKRANVYIYSGKISITGQNFTQLEAICNGLRTKVGGPWHAPTYQDLLNTVANQSKSNFLTINDTPDHRLFGEIIGTNTGFVTFQSKDLHTVGPSNTWMVLNFNTNGYFTSDMHYDLSYTLSDTDRLLCLSAIGK